jgi:hypothetical protein
MASATVTVEMRSSKMDKAMIIDEFRARSVYEAAWLAMRVWNRNWYWDSEAKYMIVRRGLEAWRVPMEKIRRWQPPPDVLEMLEQRGGELASPACWEPAWCSPGAGASRHTRVLGASASGPLITGLEVSSSRW